MTTAEKRAGQQAIDTIKSGKVDEGLRLLMQLYGYWPDQEILQRSTQRASQGDGPRVA